jgi:hypothetical protein
MLNLQRDAPKPPKNVGSIANPPGFVIVHGQVQKKKGKEDVPNREQQDDLKVKKAWEIALGPAKSIPMNAIMMYMSGSGLHIFSLMMTGMLFLNPIKALLTLNQPFVALESPSTQSRLLQAKAVFVLMQLAVMALGVYKVWIMGLLPTSGSDFLAWKGERPTMEWSMA